MTNHRESSGRLAQVLGAATGEHVTHIDIDLLKRSLEPLRDWPGTLVSLEGRGDPLCHPEIDRIITIIKDTGAHSVHLRTELRAGRAMLDQLLAAPVDVISVDLHADREATYRAMLGDDRFRDALLNIEYLTEHRRRLTDHSAAAAFGLPWIVLRIMRCRETYEDIPSFYDRWQGALGTAMIEGVPPGSIRTSEDDLLPAWTPPQHTWHTLSERMVLACNGTVPLCESEIGGSWNVGHLADESLAALWERLIREREYIRDAHGLQAPELRLGFP